ncbi:uncharacterized protein LOC131531425 isoform X3 [Onychostoma macrolepis]|uniref:Immunoglobulin domain-containing protein n=1 Tax=Onychostoma macrolepis TaxID=369639 RepID=A0A7J6BRK0_9TELE|nr:uncharacterized protein LOC131531425 isoform X3 [Onychostoma macrolepis]KAF4097341.1 hypothetical protein G5714_021349 [Onychostoma macrolepis]
MLLLFLTLLLLDGVFGAERVETMTVIEGDSVTLYTNLTELQNDDTILWLFGPKDSVISQITRKHNLTSFFVTDDGRFRDRLQVDQKTGSLTIRNTRIRHSGQYKLSISREKTMTKIFEVIVIGVVGETDGVKSLSVMEGESVILQNDVSEVQRDDLIVWRFGDKGVLLAKIDVETNDRSINNADERFRDRLKLDPDGSLTIKNTRTTDSGLYELQIRGRESSQQFLVSVSGVFGAERVETMTVIEGDSVTLYTNLTELQNDDTILWLFGPKDSVISQITRKHNLTSFFVTDDGRFRDRLQVDQKTGSLTIRNTRIRHSGQYKLSISREKTMTKIFEVIVIGVVGETDGVKSLSVMEGESVILQNDVSEVQRDDLIVWRFGDKGVLLAKIDVETNDRSINNADERFRDRLKLDPDGSLTIKNTRTTDSGLYELQIRGRESSQQFLVSVSAVPDSEPSPGLIAGIVVAALLLAAVVSSVVVHYRRKISELEKKMEKKVSVADGDSVILETETNLQGDDEVHWWYHDDHNLIAEINGVTKQTHGGFDERFRSKLVLNDKTGSLTINNTMIIHSGLYILQISSNSTNKRINKRLFLQSQ